MNSLWYFGFFEFYYDNSINFTYKYISIYKYINIYIL